MKKLLFLLLLVFGRHTRTVELPFEIKDPKMFAAGIAFAGASLISAYYSFTGFFSNLFTVEKLKKEIFDNGGKIITTSRLSYSFGYLTEHIQMKLDFSNDLPQEKIRTIQMHFDDICKLEKDKTPEYLFYFSFFAALLAIGSFAEQSKAS